jgi:hypothetical protein
MTAVEWLVDQMLKQGYFVNNKTLTYTMLDHLQQQAKEMEKQQIIDAYNDGGEKGFNKFGENFEQYYNETFNLSPQDKP